MRLTHRPLQQGGVRLTHRPLQQGGCEAHPQTITAGGKAGATGAAGMAMAAPLFTKSEIFLYSVVYKFKDK